MKKIIFLIVFLFVSRSIFAQDWQTVVSTRPAYFEYSHFFSDYPNEKDIRIIQIDSIAINGIDSVFFNYHSAKDVYFPCYSFGDTGWIGSSMVVRNDGDNLFFNQQNDSILIKALAGIGQTWHLIELGAGSYIEAEVTSSQIETVIGANDSVKTIVMNAKDNLGQPISHMMNNRIIKISKQHGIVTLFKFDLFPNDTTQLNLSGRSILNKRYIYNFNVGDLFQWQGVEGYVPDQSNTYDEIRVLSKDSSADSTIYVCDNIHYRITHFGANTTYSYNHDSDTVVIVPNNYSSLNLLPDQLYAPGEIFSYGISEQLSDSAYYHDRSMRKHSGYLEYDFSSGCITDPIGSCIFWDYYYAEGLGNVAIYDGTSFPSCKDYQMVYYNKGLETWGTPLNWPLILSINEIEKSDFKIFPNPFTDVLNIECPDLKNYLSKIEISDINGKLIKSVTSEGQSELKISTGDLSPGFYLLKIESANNIFHYKLLKN